MLNLYTVLYYTSSLYAEFFLFFFYFQPSPSSRTQRCSLSTGGERLVHLHMSVSRTEADECVYYSYCTMHVYTVLHCTLYVSILCVSTVLYCIYIYMQLYVCINMHVSTITIGSYVTICVTKMRFSVPVTT